MEVEVKLRLPDAAAHEKVALLLAPTHEVTYQQENIFFDGSTQELRSQRSVLRLRFYNGDVRCVVTLKGKAVVVDGISRAEEGLLTFQTIKCPYISYKENPEAFWKMRSEANLFGTQVASPAGWGVDSGGLLWVLPTAVHNLPALGEEDIDSALGRAFVADPSRLAGIGGKLIQHVVSQYNCRDFVCLGGFRNVRNVYSWEGLKLELDETQYAFGTTYEIECETTEPEKFRQLLGELLNASGIPYSYSTITKFGVFRSGKIPTLTGA